MCLHTAELITIVAILLLLLLHIVAVNTVAIVAATADFAVSKSSDHSNGQVDSDELSAKQGDLQRAAVEAVVWQQQHWHQQQHKHCLEQLTRIGSFLCCQ